MSATPWLHVTFETIPIEDKAASLREGRPIFNDKEHVRIKFAGDRNRELVAPAHEKFQRNPEGTGYLTYAEKFPEHYAAFKRGEEIAQSGTPIEQLPFLTASERAELKALNINTAEALAALDGTPLQRLGMGGRAKKDKAQAYLDNASGSSGATRLAAENAELREMMERLQAQMAEMQAGKAASYTDYQNAGKVLEDRFTSPFNDMEDADLKAFLKDRTGQTPRGNPKHETLVSMCEDVIAQEKAEAA